MEPGSSVLNENSFFRSSYGIKSVAVQAWVQTLNCMSLTAGCQRRLKCHKQLSTKLSNRDVSSYRPLGSVVVESNDGCSRSTGRRNCPLHGQCLYQRALWLRSGASTYYFWGDRDRESPIYTTLLGVRATIIYWMGDFKNFSRFEKCENDVSISWVFQYPRSAKETLMTHGSVGSGLAYILVFFPQWGFFDRPCPPTGMIATCRKNPPPPWGVRIYYCPWSRTRRKRTPLKNHPQNW